MSIQGLYAPFAVPLALIFGLLVGSFLNVVIYRIPVMMEKGWTLFAKSHLDIPLTEEDQAVFNLSHPDSRCPKCGTGVKPWQNIPVISYLLLRGKCAGCHTPISLRYPMVEMLTAIMFGAVAWQYGWSWLTLGGVIFTAFLIALTFIDADTQYLPDQLTLPLVWLGLIYNFNGAFVSLQQAVVGTICGYMSLWLLNFVHKKLRGFDGMGGGDFKLLAALGAWLGAGVLPIVVFSAAFVGIAAALIMKVAKSQPIAFGPCLAIAGWLVFIANDQVKAGLNLWLNSAGLL
ncbi:MAG: prepilin peptidase [Neisseria sp.]|uniref:prepilin peptidase n=1 Tax=Neisseria sp. TaxID=192066 RepID=UPI0026DB4EDD|nr:A24 family peptidase [Neisseria sp.]MDO4249610.1 prepilin peptidase [Neisseria sp.]